MGIIINNIKAKDGTEIIEICSGDKCYRMNSLYNPIEEARIYAARFEKMHKDTVLIIYGYGNGIFPQAFIKEYASKALIIFYEPDVKLTQYIKNKMLHNDNPEMLGVYYVSPFISEKEKGYYLIAEFSLLLESIITYSNHEHIEVVCLPHYKELFAEEYEKFMECINYRVRKIRSNIAAAKLMGKKTVVNNIRNLQFIRDSYCADSLKGLFSEQLPAVIVSAGPSLEKNVHVLCKMKNKAFILSVDTAAAYLIQNDIIPDMIVSIDPEKPVNMFDVIETKDIPMAVSSDVNYQVLKKMENSKIVFCSTENTYIQSLYNIAGHKIDKLRSGGSVATMALSLCIYWGFRRIILVGQDLALSGDKLYAGNMIGNSEIREMKEVEGIDGNRVLTYTDYYSYLLWFEQTIRRNPKLEFIDATEGGARIHGAKIMTLEDVKNEYCVLHEDISEKLHSVKCAFDDLQKEMLNIRLSKSLHLLQELKKQLVGGIEVIEQAISIFNKKCIYNGQLEKFDNEIQAVSEFYNSIEEDFFIQRYIDATELEQFISLFERLDGISRQERYERLKKYYEILLRAAEVVYSEWEQIII